jgi:hypothetical protein
MRRVQVKTALAPTMHRHRSLVDFSRENGALSMLIDGVWFENAVRFPVEHRARPSFEMMCDLAPDQQMIPTLVEAMNVQDYDPDLRDHADRDMAEYLATLSLPSDPDARGNLLDRLSQQALRPAILACVEAKRTADETYRACRTAIDAREADPRNSSAFAYRANIFANVSARAALDAHRLCEIATGKYRAITLAAMNERWTPFNTHDATLWLIDSATKAADRAQHRKG